MRLPCFAVDDSGDVIWQNAFKVIRDPATSDVGNGMQIFMAHSVADCGYGGGIDTSGPEQGFTYCAAKSFRAVSDFQTSMFKDNLANKAVAIGMKSGGRNADENIAGSHAMAAIHEVFAFGDAHAEAGHIEIAGGVEVRHDGCFAAQERGPSLDAAIANAGDEVFEECRVILAEGNVVEEEQGFSTEAETVIDAHRDEVDTHRVVNAGMNGDFDLGAHTIGAGNEHRVFELAAGVKTKQPGKSAGQIHDTGSEGATHELRQFLHGLLVEFKVNAGGTIGEFRHVLGIFRIKLIYRGSF